jgi:hypothetical protein
MYRTSIPNVAHALSGDLSLALSNLNLLALDGTQSGDVRRVLAATHRAVERALHRLEDVSYFWRPLGEQARDWATAPLESTDWLNAREAALAPCLHPAGAATALPKVRRLERPSRGAPAA